MERRWLSTTVALAVLRSVARWTPGASQTRTRSTAGQDASASRGRSTTSVTTTSTTVAASISDTATVSVTSTLPDSAPSTTQPRAVHVGAFAGVWYHHAFQLSITDSGSGKAVWR